MRANPPPPICDQCKRMPQWVRLTGPDRDVTLDDGRIVVRRGQVWVCPHCGHSTPVSFEAFT